VVQQGNIRFFIPPDLIEAEALQQVRNTASMPFVHGVAVMPDVHFGLGSTIGTVVATEGAVMPAAVGVDIGCGMIAVRTSLTREQVMPLRQQIREGIERRIPVGVGSFGVNSRILPSAEPRISKLKTLEAGFGLDMNQRAGWEKAMGSLGGGNHFIEVCLGYDYDSNESVWVILHSGSRGVGNKTGNYWTKMAKSLHAHEFSYNQFPDANLSWLSKGTLEYEQYMNELTWCQEFARLNREEMMDRVLSELGWTLGQPRQWPSGVYPGEVERINSHHNYARPEEYDGKELLITRKGAIRADVGKRSLIPGSMGTNSYIVEGLGNDASFNSAPHGAGRRMSRRKARELFTVESVTTQMAERDVEARVRDAIVDEAPGAYKDIEETMAHARELVRPLYRLRQIINVKGD
jgi:tRNA-splicing ligase RtcB